VSRPGHSLVEVLVALLLFVLGALGAAATAHHATALTRRALAEQRAATAAAEVLDSLLALPAPAAGARDLDGIRLRWSGAAGGTLVVIAEVPGGEAPRRLRFAALHALPPPAAPAAAPRRRRPARARAGFTLLELLVALALTGLLGVLLAGTFSAQLGAARRQVELAALAELRRVVRHVLAGELRYLDAPADVAAIAPDSLALRALRGTGRGCAAAPGHVAYRGWRDPEPAKDSALVLGPAGSWSVRPVTAADRRSGVPDCAPGPGEHVLRLALGDGGTDASGDDAATPLLVVVFESGSYHLQARALRYRRGASGRQPLTAELLRDGASRFDAAPAAVRVVIAPAPAGRPVAGVRVRVLNGP
jgi:prepilin-type N-terminal cleavage/methylation domain-containing protein